MTQIVAIEKPPPTYATQLPGAVHIIHVDYKGQKHGYTWTVRSIDGLEITNLKPDVTFHYSCHGLQILGLRDW